MNITVKDSHHQRNFKRLNNGVWFLFEGELYRKQEGAAFGLGVVVRGEQFPWKRFDRANEIVADSLVTPARILEVTVENLK